jgi:voltage-gated potassium channel
VSRKLFLRRVGFLAALLLVLLAVGTAGFMRFPGWSFSDALYMTVTTITAVGYQEVHPLNDAGRTLAGILLAGGITGMGLWFALLTSAIVEMDLAEAFRSRRTMKKIVDLSGHVVVCGAGRSGRQVVRELAAARVPYVAVDRDPRRAELVREIDPEALVLEADATRDETLEQAGVRRARGLITALSADTDNLFVCLSARSLSPSLTIVARALDEEAMSKLYRAGADHCVSPNITGGVRMASMLLRPQVVSFLDVVMGEQELALRLEEVRVPGSSPLAGKSLSEVRIPQKTGLIVIAVYHEAESGERELVYNPGSEERIRERDTLIALGEPDRIDRLRRMVGA